MGPWWGVESDPRIASLPPGPVRAYCEWAEALLFRGLRFLLGFREIVEALAWALIPAWLLWLSAQDWQTVAFVLAPRFGLILAFVWLAGVWCGTLLFRNRAK